MVNKTISCLLIFIFSILSAKDYKGAELRTIDSYVYGRFEICYKSVRGAGALATFFSYHDFTTSTADWNEVDIEILGRYEDDLQFTTITPYQQIYNSHSYFNFNPADDYHVYAFEWTPDYIAWFADGQELYRQTGEQISTLTRPQKIMMNIWAPDGADSWAGKWDPQILPLFAYYDWISYAAYTPGVGNTGTGNNFTRLWRDDFDNFDSERWEKATHTWNGNRVDLTPENAVFKDGKLILCLTEAQNTGLTDNNPPEIIWARTDSNKVIIRFSEQVDSSSAVNIQNYGISGLEIKSLEFLSDKRTIVLYTSDIITGKAYTLAVFNMKDSSPSGNVKSYQVFQIINNPTLAFPLRINVGGNALYNNKYLPDQIWAADVEYGRMDGWIESTNADIIGTDEDLLYQTACNELVKYKIRVPAGIYSLDLLMSENKFSQQGSRIFSIVVEGNTIIKDLDLVKEAGQYHAYKIIVPNISVTDGILDIHFTNWINKPVLNGIILDKISTKIKTRYSEPPRTFNVYQNFPNPFNPTTSIKYDLPELSKVSLTIYNPLGQIIQKINMGYEKEGFHQKEISLNLASGIYFYKISAYTGERFYADIKKMVVLK